MIKKKNNFIVAALLIFIIAVSGCSSEIGTHLPDLSIEVGFSELKFLESDREGYAVSAQTELAQYYFINDDEQTNTDLARGAEIAFAAVKLYDIPEAINPRVFFKNDRPNTGARFSRVTIDVTDRYSIGSVFFYASYNKLPAWLCAGLELYWQDICGVETFYGDFEIDKDIDVKAWNEAVIERGLPSFGDMWFIPGLIDSELSLGAPSVAYAFVKHLNEAGRLNEFVSAFNVTNVYNNIMGAEAVFANAWVGFTEAEAGFDSPAVRYYFSINDYTDSLEFKETVFRIYSIHGIYGFMGSDYWTGENVMARVAAMEDGFAFAKEWFGRYEIKHKVVAVILTAEIYTNDESDKLGIAGYTDTLGGGMINLFNCSLLKADVIVHEACHVFLKALGIKQDQSLSVKLEEGLCNLVSYQYSMSHEGIAEFYQSIAVPNMEDIWYDIAMDGALAGLFAEKYEERAGRPYAVGELDLIAMADAKAIWDGGYYSLRRDSNPDFAKYLSERELSEYLYGLYRPDSFMLYLSSKAAKEDVLRAYADISPMEEIYGKDIYGMIAEWMDYLGVTW